MVNLRTKFEVSRCTHYEAMNGMQNAKKIGSFGVASDLKFCTWVGHVKY